MKRTATLALALSVLAAPPAAGADTDASASAARLQGFVSGLMAGAAGTPGAETAYIVRYTPCDCRIRQTLDDFAAIEGRLRAAERRIDDRARFENMPVEGF